MPLNIRELLRRNHGRNYDLHREHINPQFVRALKTIGFDRCYVRGQGQYLWDIRGEKYLDMLSGYAVFNLGRNHPDIRRALGDFLEEDYPSLVQMDAPVLSGLLAEELKRRMPEGLEMVYFTNSGAEGVETAIKFARCATGRPAILHCNKAFHGLTTGALSLNGDETFRTGFAPLDPECREIPFNDLTALEEALARPPAAVAAFIVEPIQGKGVNIPDPGYLRDAAALCRTHGALFILDEVQTGIGRTGRFLALEHEGEQTSQRTGLSQSGSLNVQPSRERTGDGGQDNTSGCAERAEGREPAAEHLRHAATPNSELRTRNGSVHADIVILSKALSGGYVPVGAVVTRKWIYRKVFSSMDRAVVHSSTFGQGGLAMVAGLATLRALDEHNLMANAERMGAMIRDGLQPMVDRFEFLHGVRQRGVMIGIQFGRPASIRLRTAWSMIHGMDANLFPQAVTMPLLEKHRILTQVAGHATNVIKLLPPLVINEDDVRCFLDAFEEVMIDLHQFPGPVWGLMKRLGKAALTQQPRGPRETVPGG